MGDDGRVNGWKSDGPTNRSVRSHCLLPFSRCARAQLETLAFVSSQSRSRAQRQSREHHSSLTQRRQKRRRELHSRLNTPRPAQERRLKRIVRDSIEMGKRKNETNED